MKLVDFYISFKKNDEVSNKMRSVLLLTDWLSLNADFDPKSEELIPQSLSDFLYKINQVKTEESNILRDRLWRIIKHSRSSIERLLNSLNTSPRRDQALLPIYAVRELDSNSFIRLCNRPGRNIREKLAGNPYLQSVRRFQSTDIPENRLLKAFVSRLAEMLELRQYYLEEDEDELYLKIQRWLRSDEAKKIGAWNNLPPNNTLLSHRDYRRIWDSWRWLQSLDSDLEIDLDSLDHRKKMKEDWKKYAEMYATGDYIFVEMPIVFNYDKFEIIPFSNKSPIYRQAKRKIIRNIVPEKINEVACIDLTLQHPQYAYRTESTIENNKLLNTFIWQSWKNKKETIDIDLFNSDALFVSDNVNTISSSDLFFSTNNSFQNLDKAAQLFSIRLNDCYFKNDVLLWLVPDYLSDFELEIIRRNINAKFPKSEPIPRSIAFAFEQINYSKITNDGFSILVIDNTNGKVCATKLIAKLDEELKHQLPETCGYYFERCPTVILSNNDSSTNIESKIYDIISVDSNNQWTDAKEPIYSQMPYDIDELKKDKRIGEFAYCINISKSPVLGGIRLHSLQQKCLGIPLWRDHIAELSIKVRIKGRYSRFTLVGKNTTIRPVRGEVVKIPINNIFTLPKGKLFYQLPLILGESDAELGFSARLESPQFPFESDTKCDLNLTYTYGDDKPYKLTFIPHDKSLYPINVSWKQISDDIIIDSPSPKYPDALTWQSLRKMPKPNSEEVTDMLEWALSASKQLDRFLQKAHTAQLKMDRSLQKSAPLEELKMDIRRGLYVPFITIWGNGRSIEDTECPREFTSEIVSEIEHINSLLHEEIPTGVENELLFILSCLHKDTTEDCINWIYGQLECDKIKGLNAIGFALGDLSRDWQQDIFNLLLKNMDVSTIRIFSYAIWREKHFVDRLSVSKLRSILNILTGCLKKIKLFSEENNKFARPKWIRSTCEPLELLLGLLRTRSSTDPEIKMLLQPHQKITKDFAEEIERITDIVERSNVDLLSRIKLDIKKPEGDRTPDLLYALRLYLTGDDEANAICVMQISDTDND